MKDLDKIKEVLVDIFDLQIQNITNELNAEKLEQWDSMNHLRLITALEKKFDVKLSMKDVQSMTSLCAIEETISRYHN